MKIDKNLNLHCKRTMSPNFVMGIGNFFFRQVILLIRFLCDLNKTCKFAFRSLKILTADFCSCQVQYFYNECIKSTFPCYFLSRTMVLRFEIPYFNIFRTILKVLLSTVFCFVICSSNQIILS